MLGMSEGLMKLKVDSGSIKDESDHPIIHMPDKLIDYARTHLDRLSESTKYSYRRRWIQQISSRPESLFADKVHALALWITNSYEIGIHKDSTFRQFKASFCFGLSTILDDEGLVKPEFYDGKNWDDYYSNLYTYVKNFKLNKGLDSAHKESEEGGLHSGEKNADDELRVSGILNTSSLKDKKFPKELYEWIMQKESKNKESLRLLQMFLKANLLLGLRPAEWLNVRMATNIETKTSSLVIDNSKDSHGRANGSTRTIILIDATKDEKRAILDFKEAFDAALQCDFERFKFQCEDYYNNGPRDKKRDWAALGQRQLELQHGVGKTWNPIIRDVPLENLVDSYGNLQPEFAYRRLKCMGITLNRLLKSYPDFKKGDRLRPSLYSTRHQVVANAKQNNTPVREMAAFFGHSSVHTARRHYAKAGDGCGKFKFKPDPECVLLVSEQGVQNATKPTSALATTKTTELSLADRYQDW